jgi:hypothetical protein
LQSTHLEHLEEILLRNDQTLEPLLLLYRALGKLFECRVVAVRDRTAKRSSPEHILRQAGHLPVSNGHLVIETVVNGRTDAKMAAVVLLGRFSENMGRRVPEHLLA